MSDYPEKQDVNPANMSSTDAMPTAVSPSEGGWVEGVAMSETGTLRSYDHKRMGSSSPLANWNNEQQACVCEPP